jgi:hypothetical protein
MSKTGATVSFSRGLNESARKKFKQFEARLAVFAMQWSLSRKEDRDGIEEQARLTKCGARALYSRVVSGNGKKNKKIDSGW